jgi:hypothetical protein
VSEASGRIMSWVEPGTLDEYPIPYFAYRRAREAQEKPPPRHRSLGPDLDHYLSRRWRREPPCDGEVVLTFRPGAPPRVRRIVTEVLRGIRRGRPAREAIRRVARRFGLRHAHARAFITGWIGFEIRPRPSETAPDDGVTVSASLLGDWI